jgi:hypothetical protein
MKPSRFVLPRRRFLRGAIAGASVAIGLPALEAMLDGNGTALAAGTPLPRRMGIFFWGNGIRHKRWVPAQQGPTWALSDQLAPLAKVKPYVNLVTGMNVKTGNEQGHHAGTVGILSGRPMVSQPHPSSAYASTFSGPSIDQIVAASIGRTTPFPSLEIGVSRQITENEGTTLSYLSHRGPDAPNPPEYDPDRLFDRLFGAAGRPGSAPGDASGRTSALHTGRALGKSVLDAVAEDTQALARALGGPDRRRMDQHLASIREIERRVTTTWPRPATSVSLPGGRCSPAARPSASEGEAGRFPHAVRTEQMSHLLALALACDLTRVFSFMFSGSVGETAYWEVGEEKSHHQLTHDEEGDQPTVHAATVFVMRQYATLLEILAATPDGAGNLLDSSVILATSDTADGREHSLEDYPIVLAGRAAGALKYPGVHYRSDRGENTSCVLLSVLRAAGLPLPFFGEKGGAVDRGVSAIET